MNKSISFAERPVEERVRYLLIKILHFYDFM